MAKRHRELLARLEPVGLNRYQIIEADVQTVLRILQAKFKEISVWHEMLRYGGPYGTSLLIHEVVEIRELEARGLRPLKQPDRADPVRLLGENIEYPGDGSIRGTPLPPRGHQPFVRANV